MFYEEKWNLEGVVKHIEKERNQKKFNELSVFKRIST